MRRRAHAEAVRQFLAHGLHLTERRTGVLIFASVAERHAEIVADAGINAKVDAGAWESAIAAMIAAIKDGRPADGIRRRSRAVWRAARAAFPARRHQSGRTAQQTGGDVSAKALHPATAPDAQQASIFPTRRFYTAKTQRTSPTPFLNTPLSRYDAVTGAKQT